MAQNPKSEEGVDFSGFFPGNQNNKQAPAPKRVESAHPTLKMAGAIIFVIASLAALGYFIREYTKTTTNPANYTPPAGYHMTNTPGEPPKLEKNP